MATETADGGRIKHTTVLDPFQVAQSVMRGPTFHSLSQDQLERLHAASLEILERVGARFYHPGALERFRKAGVSVSDGNLVRIPHRLVARALASVPKQVLLFDRNGERAMHLYGRQVYFGLGSDCMYIWDPHTRERRLAVYNDQVNAIRVADQCRNIDFTMSAYLPSDLPPAAYDRYQMLTMLAESTKPVVFINNGYTGMVDCWEMAALVRGGMDALERLPLAVCYTNATSATHHNVEAVDKLIYCAEHALPIIYSPGASAGTTAPITTAGALALGNAGNLAGLVLSQLVREGAPLIMSPGSAGGLDLKTLISPYGAPDAGPFGWDLLHYYGLPIFGQAGASDSKLFDGQAAAEAALSIFVNALVGANLVHDLGYIDCGMNFSLESLVFCDEMIGWTKRYLRGLEITEETLALDLIERVGPDGNYLDTNHTLRHCRETWQPELLDRHGYDRWVEAGSAALCDRANDKVRQIITGHRCRRLPADLEQQLLGICRRAEETAV